MIDAVKYLSSCAPSAFGWKDIRGQVLFRDICLIKDDLIRKVHEKHPWCYYRLNINEFVNDEHSKSVRKLEILYHFGYIIKPSFHQISSFSKYVFYCWSVFLLSLEIVFILLFPPGSRVWKRTAAVHASVTCRMSRRLCGALIACCKIQLKEPSIHIHIIMCSSV